MRYVEYDADGNIFHRCEALITEPSAPPLFASDEDKAAHESRMTVHRSFGRSLQVASLIDSHNKHQEEAKQAGQPTSRGIHILKDTDDLPTMAGDENTPPSHVFDHGTSKLRKTTVAEKKAHRDKQTAVRVAQETELEAKEQARVDKAVDAAMARRKL